MGAWCGMVKETGEGAGWSDLAGESIFFLDELPQISRDEEKLGGRLERMLS